MQSEANGNVYQILVHEMNWKRPLHFLFFSFILVVGAGGREGCLLSGIMICLAAVWYCAFLFLFPLCLLTLPVSSISKGNACSYCFVL